MVYIVLLLTHHYGWYIIIQGITADDGLERVWLGGKVDTGRMHFMHVCFTSCCIIQNTLRLNDWHVYHCTAAVTLKSECTLKSSNKTYKVFAKFNSIFTTTWSNMLWYLTQNNNIYCDRCNHRIHFNIYFVCCNKTWTGKSGKMYQI